VHGEDRMTTSSLMPSVPRPVCAVSTEGQRYWVSVGGHRAGVCPPVPLWTLWCTSPAASTRSRLPMPEAPTPPKAHPSGRGLSPAGSHLAVAHLRVVVAAQGISSAACRISLCADGTARTGWRHRAFAAPRICALPGR
jgi:hypothetical protein